MKNTRKKNRNKAKTRTKKMKGGDNVFDKISKAVSDKKEQFRKTVFPTIDDKTIENNEGILNLENSINDIKRSIQPQKNKIDTKKGEINEIRGKIDVIKGKIDVIKGKIKNETDENSTNDLKSQLSGLVAEKNKLVTDLNDLIVEKDKLENDKDYKNKLEELNKKENKLIAKNRNKAVLDNNSESKKNDVLINKTKKNLVLYLQEKNPKSSENYAAKDFVDLVNLATENGSEKKEDLITTINAMKKKIAEPEISETDDEYKKINEYFEAQKITKIVMKIKKILADFLALKHKEKNPGIKQNDLVNKYKELLNKKYDELKNQAKNYGELKTIVFDQLKLNPEDHILPKEIDTIDDAEYESAINAKDNRTSYQKAKDIGSTVKDGFFSGINSIITNGSAISGSLASLAKTLIYDPNAVPKPKPLPKTEIYMGTETTDYKHPLDGTNIGQINVFKKNNSVNVDSIKSVDNFISRVQEELLNSSEKNPSLVKTAEQLFKNKDTEKRVAVFHPLNDKAETGDTSDADTSDAKKGGNSRRKTRKYKNAKL